MTKFLTVFFAWIVVYVAVTGTLMGFEHAQFNMPLQVQTLLLTVVLVPSMIFIVGPLAGALARNLMKKFS